MDARARWYVLVCARASACECMRARARACQCARPRVGVRARERAGASPSFRTARTRRGCRRRTL
eukprot:1713047-Pleurochrysis_carterae.AAC.2